VRCQRRLVAVPVEEAVEGGAPGVRGCKETEAVGRLGGDLANREGDLADGEACQVSGGVVDFDREGAGLPLAELPVQDVVWPKVVGAILAALTAV
jgi:hypothetical protein